MRSHMIALAIGAAPCALANPALAADSAPAAGPEIVVNGTVATQQSSSATGLPLTILDTPQAVTVVDHDRIKDFALTNVNDLLDTVPGVNVERIETDRTEYDARGFNITSFQVDGIGLPMLDSTIAYGAMDTALWDKVEVVRGANGMMTGVGNPSATVNYVRKRPTDTFHASVTGSLGSYNDQRVEGDISGPLTKDGSVKARLIAAHESSDSYLDYYHNDRTVVGGIVSWEVTQKLTATAGYNRQQNNSRGVLWGSLPLSFSNGAQITSYPRSATTAAPWTYWNTRNQSAFGELTYDLGHGWSVKGVYTWNRTQYDAKLLYAYPYADQTTGLGLTGYSGIYPGDYQQNIWDGYASGPVDLFGRRHDVALGVSTGRTHTKEWAAESSDEIDYPSIDQLGQVTVPEPTYGDPYLAADIVDRITRVYGAIHWNLTDRLKAITGFSATWLKSTGSSYGVDESRNNSKVTPYVGALYDITGHIKLYGSYTGIFNPQSQVGIDNRRLDPATGYSVEAGLKSQWLGGKLYASAAWFRAHQNNLAEYAGTFGPGEAGQEGGSYYTGQSTTSQGIELELAGKVTDNWTLSGGYTGFSLRTPDGLRAFTYIPNRTLKLSTTYAIPRFQDLKLGANLRWQNGTSYTDTGVTDANGNYGVIRQRGYGVVDLMASARVVDHVRAAINLRNIGNAKYLNSLAGGQAYYAAPRTIMGSLTFTY
jgi:outer-membrane receptor for ferric coprogen and ferric-rhodotorulic acid